MLPVAVRAGDVDLEARRWELRKQAIEALRRACLLGSVNFPFCFFIDLILRKEVGIGDSLGRAALRVAGLTAVAFGGYVHCRVVGQRMRQPLVMATLYAWNAQVFAALAAIPTGGVTSPYTIGSLSVSMLYAILIPGGARTGAAALIGGPAIFQAIVIAGTRPPRPFALAAAMGIFHLIVVGAALVAAALFERLRSALAETSITDSLTGLPNRRYLFERLRELATRSRRHQPVAVVMVDIDFFKRINDTHGHASGDDALRSVARLIAAEIRTGVDLCGRYGGEEFVLVLDACDADGARAVAERIRRQVAATPIVAHGERLKVTISAGVACSPPGERIEPDRLVDRADQALLAAKQSGRNRVECAASH